MSKRDISIVVDEGGAAGDGVGVKTAKGGPDGSPPLNALSPILAASAAGEAGLDDAQRRAKHRKDLLLDDDVRVPQRLSAGTAAANSDATPTRPLPPSPLPHCRCCSPSPSRAARTSPWRWRCTTARACARRACFGW